MGDNMKYLKSLSLIIIPTIVSSFLISCMYNINWINSNIYSYLKLFLPIICLLIGGIYLGKHSKENGWLEGLKLGSGIVLFLFILSYLAFDIGFTLKSTIYYVIFLFTTTLGSMIGIRNVESTKNTR